MRRPLADHLAEYKRDGYTIFRGFLSPEEVASIRRECDPKMERRFSRMDNPLARTTIGGHDGWSGGEETALGTMLMGATVFHPSSVLLDFVESVMGPCVQHDSLQVACYPPVPAEYSGVGYGWHFDGFNTSTTSTAKRPKSYTPPSACNCLTYLQDMGGPHGAFRCVPGSHLDFGKQVPKRESGAPISQHWYRPALHEALRVCCATMSHYDDEASK